MPIHPAAKEALNLLFKMGRKAIARGIDSVAEDVENAATEMDRGVKKFRGDLKKHMRAPVQKPQVEIDGKPVPTEVIDAELEDDR